MDNELGIEFLSAIDLIAKKRVSELAFDKTISPCQILKRDDVDESKYLVEYEAAIFDAYVQGSDVYYYEGDSVYVLIPHGDWSKTKIITGKCVESSVNKIFNFKFPMEDFVTIDEMTWEQQKNSIGFIANKPFEQELSGNELLKNATNQYYYLGSCRPSTGEIISTDEAPSLGVRVNVQTLLAEYNLINGVYGLFFVVQGKNQEGETAYFTEFFTSKDMYGNPYAYVTAMPQEKVIDFIGLSSIEKIEVWAWQDLNFRDAFNELIDEAPIENIFLNNISLSLGAIAKKEELKIYNYDRLSYGISPSAAIGKTEEELQNSNRKTLRASWAVKIDDVLKVFNEFNTPTFNEYNFKIRWYKKATNTLLYDNYAGPGWQLLDFGAEKEVLTLKQMEDFSSKYNEILSNKQTSADEKTKLIKQLLSSNEDKYPLLVTNFNLVIDNLVAQNKNLKEVYNVDINDLYGDFAPINHFTLDVNLDNEVASQTFKAIVFYNGTYMYSNELTFTNEAFNTTSQDLAAIDENIVLKVQRPLLQKLNEQQDNWGHKTREISNFYCYAETNNEIANADGVMPSEITYPISVYIRDVNDGIFRPMIASDYEEGSLKWIYSVHSASMPSMISEFQKTNRDLCEQYNFDAINGERQTTAFFKINGVYHTNYTNNVITAQFMRGGALYRVSKTLDFGYQSTMGSRYTATISIIDPAEGDYIPFTGPFQLRCTVTDSITGETVSPLALTYNWRFITDDNGATDRSFLVLENRSTGVVRCSADAATTLRPPIVECTIGGLPDIGYNLIVRKGLAITTDEFANETNIYCPDRIQFNSDGSKPLYQRDVFQVYNLDDETFIYPAWKMNYNDYFCLNATVADTTRTAYAAAEDAVEDESIVPEDESEAEELEDFVIAAQNFYTPLKIDGISHKTTGMEYGQSYNDDGSLNELDSLDPDDIYFTDWLDESCPIGYKLVPKKENLQWEIDMRDTYLYVSFTLNDGTYFAQAIVLDQNEYVSALVNEWDGKSIVLDEEHSALMSNMLAVGTKDRNNKFTGIMMGDWTGHNDGSMDVPGLYGYQQGVQSFGFLTTGQAFLGQYGKGRIFFDGNYALISNADKTNYINLNPEPGFWGNNPMVSTGPSSSYFLYSQVPKYYNLDEDDEPDENGLTNARKHELFIQWYKQFQKDKEHDYFIVDPNRGILTTGGVGANWGYIGSWIIDNGYLYYSGTDYRFYLGQPSSADDTGVEQPWAILAEINDGNGGWTPQFGVDWYGNLLANAGIIGGFGITEDKLFGEQIQLNSNGSIVLGPHDNLVLSSTENKTSVNLAYGTCDLFIGPFQFSSQGTTVNDTISEYYSGSGINSSTEFETTTSQKISVSLGTSVAKTQLQVNASNVHTLKIGDIEDSSESSIELISGDINVNSIKEVFVSDEENNKNVIDQYLHGGGEEIDVNKFTQTIKESPEDSDDGTGLSKIFMMRPTGSQDLNYLVDWKIQSPQVNANESYIKNLTSEKIYVINEDEEGIISSDLVATQGWVDARILSWLGKEGTIDDLKSLGQKIMNALGLEITIAGFVRQVGSESSDPSNP